jgi:MFS family permease
VTRAPRTDAFDRRLFAPMLLGTILNPVNSSIVAVALVPIGAAFGAPASQTAWLVSALYLATSIGQPLIGRFVDVFGPRRMFLIGAALTGIAGVIGALAPNLWVLVAARVILGFGTCAGYPASMSIIRSESKRTGIASPAGVLTALSIAGQTIAAVGPTIGGLLIGFGGWRATLAINVPLAIAGLVLGALYLPRTRPTDPAVRSAAPRPRFDVVGVLLFAATLVSLLLFLMDPHVADLWYLGIAVVAAAGFALRELRADDPFIDVRVFAGNVPLLVTYARGVLAATVSYCFLYGVTQWLEEGRGLSASAAGLVLLPTFATGIAVAAITGKRAEVKGKLVVGAVAQVIGCALLLFVHAHVAVVFLVVVAIVLGIPQGLVNLAIQNALYHQADPARMGASSGLLRTFMYLGAMIASSASGAFYGSGVTDGGVHVLAWFMVVAAAVLLAMTVVDRGLAKVGRPA